MFLRACTAYTPRVEAANAVLAGSVSVSAESSSGDGYGFRVGPGGVGSGVGSGGHRRRTRVAVVSDDVQWERARQVGPVRGDPPDHWRAVRRAESAVYADRRVDAVLSISGDDAAVHRAMQADHGKAVQADPSLKAPPSFKPRF